MKHRVSEDLSEKERDLGWRELSGADKRGRGLSE